MEEKIKVSLSLAAAISYAGIHNSIPVIQEIRLETLEEEPQLGLSIRVTMSPDLLLRPKALHVARLEAGSPISFSHPELAMRHDQLASLQEAHRGVVLADVLQGEAVLASTSAPVEVLAYDEWAGF